MLWPWLQALQGLLAQVEAVTDLQAYPDGWLEVRVARRWEAADDTVAFELVDRNGRELPPFEAGSYIDVLTPRGHLRPYSLCNSPLDRSRFIIAVRVEAQGRGGSLSLHHDVTVGDQLRVRGPHNEFPLNVASVYSVLLAGGVGIAPLLSMAHVLWTRGAPFTLHYSARNESAAPFAADLAQVPFASFVRFHWTESWGRPDFKALLAGTPHGADVYVCGPPGYSCNATAAYLEGGRHPGRLHAESFEARPNPIAR